MQGSCSSDFDWGRGEGVLTLNYRTSYIS